MANVFQSGSIFADTNGVAHNGAIKVTSIVFTSTAITDTVTIYDGDAVTDPIKCKLNGSNTHGSVQLDFSMKPLMFTTGIFIAGLSANCSLMFATTSAGSGS